MGKSRHGIWQMPEQREKLDGLYECISVRLLARPRARRSGGNPPDKFNRPVTGSWLCIATSIDSCDTETGERQDGTERCWCILLCVTAS